MTQERQIPAWLLKSQNYAPPRDADVFIDRSMRAFLGLLGRLRRQPSLKSGGGQHPGIALGLALLTLTLISLSQHGAFISVCGVACLAGLSLLPARSIARVAAAAISAGVLSLLILLPAWYLLGPGTYLAIPVKIVLNLLLMGIVAETQGWAGLSTGLAQMRVPGLIIVILDLALRYISFLGDFAVAMLQALRLRSVGRNHAKTVSLSGIVGTLFLKSRQMALECHAAMECRGFTGSFPQAAKFRLVWADLVLIGLAFGVVTAFMVWG